MNRTLISSGALTLALVAGGAAGYAVHGTSSDTDTTKSASTQLQGIAARGDATAHNGQDVDFAHDMVEHHQQAVVMAGLAATRSTDPQVRALAQTIEEAQSPEIRQMTGWLSSWGVPTRPSSTAEGTEGMSSGSMTMGGSPVSGMMSATDMSSLGALRGSAFDTMFLTMMTQHHDGAIDMAQQELKNGEYADSLALAASIVVSQHSQVQQMRQLLTA